MEVPKQGQFAPVPVSEQVVMIFAVTEGYMDGIEISQVQAFEAALLEHMRARHGSLLDEIAETGQMDEDAMSTAITAFAGSWAPEGG